MSLIFIIVLALALPHGASALVSTRIDCVLSLKSVISEGSWSGSCLSQNRNGAHARFYTFSLLQQSDVTITLESETDPYLFLLSGSGADADYIAENDDIDTSGQNFNSRIKATLEPGDYTIEATTYEKTATGEFTLTLRGVGPLDDRAALVAIYRATGGDDWDDKYNWLTDAPLDDWDLVRTDDHGRVVDLSLGSNDLTGHIPRELGDLSELEYLELGGNLLTGTLPPELGNLVKLVDLFLEENRLTGTIPSELGNLAALERLSLNENRFWGELPLSMSGLSKLRSFEFDDNSAGLCAPADADFQRWLSSVEDFRGDSCVQPVAPPDEREMAALTAIYNATGGDDWFDRTNWFSDEPVQFWSGISVNGEGHISELRLWGNNLSGEIPTQLSHLTSLERLYLSGNDLTGTIPEELGSLTGLERLYLYRNQLSGSIPAALGNLSLLRRLNLSDNQLTGLIPSEIGNLKALEQLELHRNRLSGSIPTELGDLSGLEELALWSNELTGPIPPELGQMRALREMRISENQLEGPIPPELGHMGSLEGLDLSSNRLTGEFPTALVNLPKLLGLNLADNLLSGELPAQIGDFENLSGLILDDNLFSGSVPPEIGELTTLWSLQIARNQLSAEIPSELGDLLNLGRLDLSGNQFSSEIPKELGDLQSLRRLNLSDNLLTGAIPQELGDTSLFELDLSGNQLVREIPTEFGNLIYMNRLDLGGNRLTGSIPAELHRLGKYSLNELEILLGDNLLSGAVPAELGKIWDLKTLEVHNNLLSGELPREFTGLQLLGRLYFYDNEGLCAPDDTEFQEWLHRIPQVSGDTCDLDPVLADRASLISLYNSTGGDDWRNNTNWLTDAPLSAWYGITTNPDGRVAELWLNDNDLTGSIPPEVGSLSGLRVLVLKANQLSGPIPGELANLTNLEVLSLWHNQLEGPIPPQLGELTHLRELWLHNNRLTGTIPSELSNLIHSLDELLLSGNQLEGCIPQVLRGVETNDFDELGLPFCESADRVALTALYESTDGDNWFNNTNWLTAAPISEWHGVSTNSEGRVVTLDLSGNSLSGAFPPEVGELINLRYLGIGSNQLTGTLPPEVGNLTRLEVLNLSSNRLWGPLPDAMTALSVLHRFEFQHNSGLCAAPDPGFQEWLQSIPLLGRGPTCVRPAPPDDRDVAALTTLYSATSSDNWLDSTNWLSDQPLQYWKGVHINEEGRVVELRLGGNNLSGQIPPELGNLGDLERLELYGNQLTGTIPSELGSLSNLELLSIEHNQLTGSIPARLNHLVQLTSLRLNSNQLAGAIPSELGSLNNLQILLLDDNRLAGSIPSELGSLSELVVLWLDNNQLTGTIPPELGDPPNLGELFLTNNQLTGCIPFTLSDIPGNDFTQLDLPFCDNPDRAVLIALYHATKGDTWTNNTNWLTDAPLHKWYGVDTDNKWNVHELSLSDNRLTGQLPPELGDFHFVKGLQFDNNQLTGQVPPELGNLTKNLVLLWLHSNQLAGTIPPELGNLDKLVDLNVSGNQFTGELPDELTELRELYSLLFDNNAGLCAPTDAEFQQWLQSIDIVEGPTCTITTPFPTPEEPIPSECINSLSGAPAEGTWSADCRSINRTENGVHYARYYSFTLDRRATIDLTLESRTDPYLILLGETGEVFAQDDDDDHDIFDLSARDSGIRIILDPGDYIVEVTTYAGAATGDFTLTFRRPELEALQALYNATNGDSWDDSANWLTDAPLAEWYGIQTDDEGRVIGMYLSDNNLRGEIPPQLGRLSQLEWLGLANNELSGPIPPELGNLYGLRILVLFNNDLTGPIPYQLGKLQELLEMYLEGNRLSGSIPTQLGDLRKLYFLNLTDNELSGSIPSSIGNVQELRDLHIAANDLTGPIPRELGDLSKLKRLDIRDNDLAGGDFIYFRLDDLDDLSFLDIGGNRIDGRDALFHVRELFKLRGLGLHDSGLTDSDLLDYMEIIRERDLRFFDISSNELSDPQILEGLSRMSTLSYLHINDNDFGGELPQAMTGLTDMRRFHFRDNDGLCAPMNNDFKVWLDGIRDVRGDICPAEVGSS